jgi:hypothetical protein
LTGSTPIPSTPDSSSLAGTIHEYRLETAYYTTTIPIWIDEITNLAAWSDDFSTPEATEVVQAIAAYLYIFDSSDKSETKEEHNVKLPEPVMAALDAITQLVKAQNEESSYPTDQEVTRLAIDLRTSLPSTDSSATAAAEELCADAEFEYIHLASTGKNIYGETQGLARLQEALAATSWAADTSLSDEEVDHDQEHGMRDEQAEMNEELMSLKTSLLSASLDDDDDEEYNGAPAKDDSGDPEQIEGLQEMMTRLLAIKGMVHTYFLSALRPSCLFFPYFHVLFSHLPHEYLFKLLTS